MKYTFTTIIIILVAAAIIWGVYSGSLSEKTQPASKNDSGGQSDIVILETNFGPIKIALDSAAAPRTVENFEKLVNAGFYDQLTFHRIVPGFVIQGGDPKGDGTGGAGYTLPAEIKLLHKRGSVAMARLADALNPNRESSGSQFYIALADLPGLDGQYTVFGEVIEGMEIVDKIASVKTDPNNKPLEPVIIKKASVE